MWHHRVPPGAFARLELLEGKLSRAVLRGRGGSNPARLPGYLIQSSTAPYHGAFVWMAFVWTNGYSSSAQTILWNEGANPLGY